MTVTTEILDRLFNDFANFVSTADNKPFTDFKTSGFIDKAENYKYSVYDEARENLGQKWWKPEDIGTGKIQQAVSSAIKTRVNHSFQMVDNNLVDWRKKDDFAKTSKNKNLETTLFNFYKSKISDQQAFETFIDEKLSYQFIAYLFFIKDRNRFMPISQSKFDEIFELIGLPSFKTSHNLSWDNYSTYLDIIKQVRDFLKTKDKNVTLLDAHSFLWILGNQMRVTIKETQPKPIVEKNDEQEKPTKAVKDIFSKSSELNSLEWTEILQDEKLTNELDLAIFQALYSFQDHKAYASQIALILETTHPPLNLEIGRYAKRIAEHYDINFTARSAEKFKFWDLFFSGWDEGTKFIWQLRPELVEALIATGLTGDEIYPDELPTENTEELFEGIKRTVTVNSYERNSKARQLCVKHWKAICAVCSFDFEKTYGEIGKGFIHVHHLTPVSQIGKSYQVDPINDLIPVCPNCHSMLHRQEPPLTIDELKTLLNNDD
jgi:5-methylcytosine-specific restriction protein A